MKLISFNVNGLRAVVKKGFHQTLQQLDADIVCLQETKATSDQVREALFGLDGYHLYASHADKAGYSGTALLSKTEPLSVREGIGHPEHDREGRTLTAEYADFYVVGVYVPNSSAELVRLPYRTTWDRDFRNYLAGLQAHKPVILCGDLNVAHQEIDIANAKANYNKTPGYTQLEIDGMDALLGIGLVDTFRAQHPQEVKYSWWSFRAGARERNIGWRLDYFLVSKDLFPKVQSSFILPEIEGSDHCPVGIELA
jgi:exodeoxyribonuclease-3